jgi:carbamate kinase
VPETVVVALGGNALVRPGQLGTIDEQSANLDASLAVVVELARRPFESGELRM